MVQYVESIVKYHSKLAEFRENDKYTDVILECQGNNFKCHRLVLASASEFFDTMFSSEFREKTATNVLLGELSAETLDHILQFIYTGNMEICHANVTDVFRASEYLSLTELEELCVQFVTKNLNWLTVEDFLDIFIFAESTKKVALIQLMRGRIVKRFEIFSQDERFLKLPFEELKIIISELGTLLTRNDASILDGITKWVRHEREKRLQYLDELIKIIPFGNITSTFVQFTYKSLFGNSDGDCDANLESLSVALKGEPSLNVFVELKEKKSVMPVYSISRTQNCKLSAEFSVPDGTNWIRNIALDDFYLYRLSCLKDGPRELITFSAHTSINKPAGQELKPPPINPEHIYPLICICGLQNNIYVKGGALDDVILAYNREINDWFPLPEIKQRVDLYCASMTACNNRLYLIGGCNSSEETADTCALAYDYREGKWKELPETNLLYFRDRSCVLNNRIYILCKEDYSSPYEFECYDLVAGKWDILKPLDAIAIGLQYQVVPYLNQVWVVTEDLTIHTYDPKLNEWSTSSMIVEKSDYSGILKDVFVFKSI